MSYSGGRAPELTHKSARRGRVIRYTPRANTASQRNCGVPLLPLTQGGHLEKCACSESNRPTKNLLTSHLPGPFIKHSANIPDKRLAGGGNFQSVVP
jgi:hypothetical protein